jgi:hypothetical protein
MYEITLNAEDIRRVREYNKNQGYNYVDNSIDENGKSKFIKEFSDIFDIKQ